MLHRVLAILTLVVFTYTGASAQDITPRIAGLEHDADYMTMLKEDVALQSQLDSVIHRVDAVRDSLRNNPQERGRYSQTIISMEKRIFDIREERGRLVDRINTIEQDWVLANLHSRDNGETPRHNETVLPDSLKVRNLVHNLYFEHNLSREDHAALIAAQKDEKLAVGYIDRFNANYRKLSEIKNEYDTVRTEKAAADIYGKYETLHRLNNALGDSLSAVWNKIFDNKTYAYGYLMDKAGRDEILSREEMATDEARRLVSSLGGKYASDAVVDYYVRKQLVTDYELSLAKLLKLDSAADSLAKVASHLKSIDYRIPKIEVQERYFLDYSPIEFSKTTIYTYKNPIQETKIYARGTIYRIIVGAYKIKQPVAVFKGASPLSYVVGDDGRYTYFAGGYATRAEVDSALDMMKSKGFRNAGIAVWNDGEYTNLSKAMADGVQVVMFRVEISGAQILPDAVKTAIADTASGHDVSRLGEQTFTIGLFDDKAEAERVADAIKSADDTLEIKVADIVE